MTGDILPYAPNDQRAVRIYEGAVLPHWVGQHILSRRPLSRYNVLRKEEAHISWQIAYLMRRLMTMDDLEFMANLIWIQEAEDTYKRSREWFMKQIQLKKLRRVTIAGDRKVYLLCNEIAELLKPQVHDS